MTTVRTKTCGLHGGSPVDELEQMSYENSLRRCCLGQFVSCIFWAALAVFGTIIAVWIALYP